MSNYLEGTVGILIFVLCIIGCGAVDDEPAQFVGDRYYTGGGYWQVVEVYFDKEPVGLVVENAFEYHLGAYPVIGVRLTIYPHCDRTDTFISVRWRGGQKRFRCVPPIQ